MKYDFVKQYCLLPFLQSNWTIKKDNCIPIIKSELVRLWRKPTCAVKQNIPSATTATYACMSPEPPQVLYASIPVLLWWRVSCKMKKNNFCFIGTSNVENQYHSSEILAASNFFLLPLYVQLQEKTPEHKTFHLIPHKEMRGLTIFLSCSQIYVTKLAGQC